MIRALAGTRTEPVIRNSSRNVAPTTNSRAHGPLVRISSVKSTRMAGSPVTQVRKLARSDRSVRTTSPPSAVVAGTTRTTAYPPARSSTTETDPTPGRPASPDA